MDGSYDRLIPALKSALPPEVVGTWGRAVGFVRRLRQVTASDFVWAVVLSRFGSGRPAFEQARQCLFRLSAVSICPRPFQMRFKSEAAVRLLESAFEHLVRPWRESSPRMKHPLLRLFADVVAFDATPIRLHDDLRSCFRGLRNVAAQTKLILAISVFGAVPLFARLVPGHCSDLRLAPRLDTFRKGTLLLFDNGFVNYDLLRRIAEAGLFFLCPMRVHARAHVVAINAGPAWLKRELKKNSTGIQLRDWLDRHKRIRGVFDLTVRVTPRSEGADRTPVELRLVILPGPHLEQRPYLTNIDASIGPEALREVYRLRWQIELTFKEMKQHLNLETVPTKDPSAAQAFIWASLVALALSRTITLVLSPLDTAVGLERRLRPDIVSRALRANAALLGRALMAPSRLAAHFARALLMHVRTAASRTVRRRPDSFARLRELLAQPA